MVGGLLCRSWIYPQIVVYFMDDTQSCIYSQRMELFVIVIFLTVAAGLGALQSKLEGPKNTLSVIGSNVTLKCSSPSRNCNGIDWLQYVTVTSPITVFKGPRTLLNTVDRDRYSVDNSSGCDLVIRDVQLTDAGRFICSAIISSSQTTKAALLIILETQPNCTTKINASLVGVQQNDNGNEVHLNDTVEGDGVQLTCEVTYNGANNASMVWKGVADIPVNVENGSTISRSHFVVASAPEVSSFTCEASFAFETSRDGALIRDLATNSIPNSNCLTSTIKVLYSVRNVTLSPSHSNYSPGTVITCTAKGHPSPTYKWQEMETDGLWMDIQNSFGSQFNTATVSFKKYRCFAMNVVRGRNYNATSSEFLVNNTEDYAVSSSTVTPIEDTYFPYIMMSVAACILLIIIVLIICFCNETCLGYKYCNSGKKSKDNSRDEQGLTENPDVCTYSVVNKGQDIRPKTKAPKRPKNAPPQPKAGNADYYQNEEVTYADLAMEYGPRKVVPQNGQEAQEESVYAAVSSA